MCHFLAAETIGSVLSGSLGFNLISLPGSVITEHNLATRIQSLQLQKSVFASLWISFILWLLDIKLYNVYKINIRLFHLYNVLGSIVMTIVMTEVLQGQPLLWYIRYH